MEGCGLTRFAWAPRRHRWLPIAAVAVGVLYIIAMEAVGQERGRTGWTGMFAFMWMFITGPMWLLHRPLYILSHGVLTITRFTGLPHKIPLHAANIQRSKRRWRFAWPQGEVTVPAEPLLLTLIGEAMAETEDGPRTSREAERLISATGLLKPTPLAPALFIYLIAAIGLSIWLNHPLFLLPMVAMPFFAPALTTPGYLVLTPDALFVARPDAPPVEIPRSDVTEVASRGRNEGLIFTRHPDFPKLTVNRYQATDLLRRLEHGDSPKQM